EAGYDPMRQFAELAGDVRDPYPMFAGIRADTPVLHVELGAGSRYRHDEKAPRISSLFTVTSYELAQQVLTDNVRFSSAGYEMTMGQVRGRPILQMDSHDHRRHRGRADRRLRWRRPRRPHPAADLPVPGSGHRPDPRPARGRLAPLPAAVDPADRGHAELGGRSRGEPGAARLLRRDHRRPAAAHAR